MYIQEKPKMYKFPFKCVYPKKFFAKIGQSVWLSKGNNMLKSNN